MEPPDPSFSGIELALVTRDQTERDAAFTMLLTAGACLGFNHVGVGYAVGIVLALVLRMLGRWTRPEAR